MEYELRRKVIDILCAGDPWHVRVGRDYFTIYPDMPPDPEKYLFNDDAADEAWDAWYETGIRVNEHPMALTELMVEVLGGEIDTTG